MNRRRPCSLVLPINIGSGLKLAGGFEAGETTIKIVSSHRFPDPVKADRFIRNIKLAILSPHRILRGEVKDDGQRPNKDKPGVLVLSRGLGHELHINGTAQDGGVTIKVVNIRRLTCRLKISGFRDIRFERTDDVSIFEERAAA